MGILSAITGQKNNSINNNISQSILIPAPLEPHQIKAECAREATRAGFKAAAIASVIATVTVIGGCRVNPWAKANLNYSAQALLISAATISSYFITADKTILECATRHAKYDASKYE
ncbi:early nodulin-93-like [Chenopodium quinoa]|uniref:Early nodulin-93-like n=1 Tax=Chenopodium quinoa TaxID=63459 RepID=A0A803LBI2_CHEQI|nr:early nodulin-93-like [Chenopodium quinoa]